MKDQWNRCIPEGESVCLVLISVSLAKGCCIHIDQSDD